MHLVQNLKCCNVQRSEVDHQVRLAKELGAQRKVLTLLVM
jgi:hypothetical protein